jgi:hypothetical protein
MGLRPIGGTTASLVLALTLTAWPSGGDVREAQPHAAMELSLRS